jgi:hypothetical protein
MLLLWKEAEALRVEHDARDHDMVKYQFPGRNNRVPSGFEARRLSLRACRHQINGRQNCRIGRNPLPIGQSGFVTNSLERLGVSLQRCKMKSCPCFPRRRAALKSG